jgi:alpha-galactosidase
MALQQGVNTLLFESPNSTAPILDRVTVSGVVVPTPATFITYLAAASTSTLSGNAQLTGCSPCAGGEEVGSLGNGANNYVIINNVQAPATGTYAVTVYASTYVNRNFVITVNGGTPITLPIVGSNSDWTTPFATQTTLTLQQGTNNTIKFGNPSDWAPNIYSIAIATTSTAP